MIHARMSNKSASRTILHVVQGNPGKVGNRRATNLRLEILPGNVSSKAIAMTKKATTRVSAKHRA